jgi:hypothetical protein
MKKAAGVTLATFVLAAMGGTALANVPEPREGNLDSAIQWFVSHPTDFKAFLDALRDNDNTRWAAIAEFAGFSADDIRRLGEARSDGSLTRMAASGTGRRVSSPKPKTRRPDASW